MKTLLLLFVLATAPLVAQDESVSVRCLTPSLTTASNSLAATGWRVSRQSADVIIAEHQGESVACPTIVRIEAVANEIRVMFCRPVAVTSSGLTFMPLASSVTSPLVASLRKACGQ